MLTFHYIILKKVYNKNPIKKLDFIQIGALGIKDKQRYMGKDEEGKPLYQPTGNKETWMEGYKIL